MPREGPKPPHHLRHCRLRAVVFDQKLARLLHGGVPQASSTGFAAFKMLKKTILRSTLFLLLESVFFLSLQCYVYAVVRAQTTTALNTVSILLSAAAGFYHAACDATLVHTFWRHLRHGHEKFLIKACRNEEGSLALFPTRR